MLLCCMCVRVPVVSCSQARHGCQAVGKQCYGGRCLQDGQAYDADVQVVSRCRPLPKKKGSFTRPKTAVKAIAMFGQYTARAQLFCCIFLMAAVLCIACWAEYWFKWSTIKKE